MNLAGLHFVIFQTRIGSQREKGGDLNEGDSSPVAREEEEEYVGGFVVLH